jgi:hypothetical protein
MSCVCCHKGHNFVLSVYLSRCTLRPVILGQSQWAKNRNLSRLISNLSGLNCSSKRNSVYSFQQCFFFFNRVYSFTTARSTCLRRNLPCLVFESCITFLAYTSLQTGQRHSSSFPHSSPHPCMWYVILLLQ